MAAATNKPPAVGSKDQRIHKRYVRTGTEEEGTKDTSAVKLNQIGIVMLGVRDLDRSIEFYRDQLGLAVKYKIPGFAFLDAGGVTQCWSEPLAKASSQRVGATEIVFSVEHVRAAHSALQNKRISFMNEPRNVTGSS